MLRDLVERVRALLFRRTLDRELDEELAFHLEREAAERARLGSSDPDRDARLALGGVTQVREAVRGARGVRPFEEMLADVRYALRALRRQPGFTATVVAVLGLAIGAATSVFTVVDRVLLAELPYEEPHELVRVYQRYSATSLGTISVVDIQGIAAEQRSFEAFGALRLAGLTLTGVGAPELVGAGRVTSGFFAALKVRPAHGRLPLPRDDTMGAPPVVVLSHALAERAFADAARAVGQFVVLDGLSHEVIGVLGAADQALAGVRADAWPAMQLGVPERRGPFGYRGIARLREGVSVADATRDLDAIGARLFPIWKGGFQDSTARLIPVPLRDAIVGGATRQVGLFAGAVALVLLLSIANVATLLVVRAGAREHELSVRAALGAGRYRLSRLVATECVLLTTVAGAVGVALAVYALTLVGFVAPNLPRTSGIALDARGVAFATAVTLASGLLVSLAPLASVWTAGRSGRAPGAGSASRSSPGRRAAALRSALVVTEFALALPLLMGAALLFNSFLRLQRVDPGFDPAGVYALNVALPAGRYNDPALTALFWQRLSALAADANGVTAVGLTGALPPDSYGNVNNFDLLDRPVPTGTSQHLAPWSQATSGFFDALGIRLLDGRLFGAADSVGAPPVAVVSQSWAATYYGRESAVGRQMYSGGCVTCPPTTVVGVVSDLHYRGLENPADAVYTPVAQGAPRGLSLVVRSRFDARTTFQSLRAVVAALEPDLAPTEAVLADRLRAELDDPKRWTAVVGSFAVVGVALATLGIFGLMSFVVRQRRRELGVRLALGASPASLTRLIVRTGMRYAAVGTAVGLLLSGLESRWLGSLLFGVDAMDPVTLALATVALLLVAVAACLLPGVRAARIEPIEAIRSE